MSELIEKFKQFFAGYSVQTRKTCLHCGGGRCMGMCGSSLAKLSKVVVQGVVRLDAPSLGVIEENGEDVLTFKANEWFGRMILKKCPVGSRCKVEALVQGTQMEKLISIKKE